MVGNPDWIRLREYTDTETYSRALPVVIDYKAAIHFWKVDNFHFVVCISAFIGVVFGNIEIGLVLAVRIIIVCDGNTWTNNLKLRIRTNISFFFYVGCNICDQGTLVCGKAKFHGLPKCWAVSQCKKYCSWNSHTWDWCSHLICKYQLLKRKVLIN